MPGNGWDGMTLDFTDFGLGESIVFGVDVDPTTIQGVPGAGGAGAVSGLELTGSSVTVTFSDGQVLTSQIFGDGSDGGGEVAGQLSPRPGRADRHRDAGRRRPSPTVFPNNSVAGNRRRRRPPDGAGVWSRRRRRSRCWPSTATLQSPAPFDLDPFESDAAAAVAYQTGTIGAGGFVDFTVIQPTTPTLYHYVATIDDGANGPAHRASSSSASVTSTRRSSTRSPTSSSTRATPVSVADQRRPIPPVTRSRSISPRRPTSRPSAPSSPTTVTAPAASTGSPRPVTPAPTPSTSPPPTAPTPAPPPSPSPSIDPNAVPLYRVNSGGPDRRRHRWWRPTGPRTSRLAGANARWNRRGRNAVAVSDRGGENAYGTAAPSTCPTRRSRPARRRRCSRPSTGIPRPAPRWSTSSRRFGSGLRGRPLLRRDLRHRQRRARVRGRDRGHAGARPTTTSTSSSVPTPASSRRSSAR